MAQFSDLPLCLLIPLVLESFSRRKEHLRMAIYLGKATLNEYRTMLTPLVEGDYLVKKYKKIDCFGIVQVQKIRAKTILVHATGYGCKRSTPSVPLLYRVFRFTDTYNQYSTVPMSSRMQDEFSTKDYVYYRIDAQIVKDLFDDTKRIRWDGTHYYMSLLNTTNDDFIHTDQRLF
jgi:hypothetical protein